MKTLRKNLAPFQGFSAQFNKDRAHFHQFWSNIAIYTSRALMDLLCELGVIWIKTEGAFH